MTSDDSDVRGDWEVLSGDDAEAQEPLRESLDQPPDDPSSGAEPSPESQPSGPSPRRGLRPALTPGNILQILLAVGLAAYLLAQLLPQLGSSGRMEEPTATAATATQPQSSPTNQPTKAATETPDEGVSSAEGLDALLAKAQTLAQQSQFEEAFSLYAQMVDAAPDDPRPETGWAWALILDGQADQAVTHARRAVELDPVDPETISALARAHLDSGHRERALAMAEGALDLTPSSALAHAVLAEAYLHNEQYGAAAAQARRALSLDPDSVEAHRAQGWVSYLANGDASQGAEHLRAAVELEPGLWLRQHELGLTLLAAGDYEGAVEAFQRALALRPKTDTYSALGEAYYYLGQLDQAQQVLAEALSTAVDGTGAGRAAAAQSVVLAQLDRCGEARERYQQALAQEPANALALEARELCEGLPPTPLPSPSPVPTEPGVPPLQGHIFYPLWNEGDNRYDLYMRRVDGSGRELIVTGANQPALQPGGEWLAANGERHLEENLLILQPNGADLMEISEHSEDGLPAWSPDGEKLAFASTQHGDRQSRIYVMDGVPLDGRRVAGRALNTGADDARGTQPFWTDDGQIIYSGCDYSADLVRCGLLLMPAAEGSYQPVAVTTYAGDTAPAVYGNRVAFMSDRSGSWEVHAINLDGSDLVQLTNNRANDGLPTWSPDGQTIAFVSDEGGAWAVWAVDLDGANRRKLFDLEGQGLFVDWTQQQIGWGP